MAAFWARTLRWFASPTPVSMARRPACTSSTRPRPSTSASTMATGRGSGSRWPRRGWSAAASAVAGLFEQAGPVGGEHGPDDAGEGREPPGAERQPRRRRDDVFELVRLVEHDHVVLGQEGLAPGEVQSVEVGVDDHQRRRPGPAGRRHLGEARLAERAAGGAGALVARHAHRLPGPRVHRPRQLGLVAGRRRRGPARRAGTADLAGPARSASSSSSSRAAWSSPPVASRRRCRQT